MIIQESSQSRKLIKERGISRGLDELFWVKVIKTLITIDKNIILLLIFLGTYEENALEISHILKSVYEKESPFEDCLI
jgi:hypothetical protein